MADLLEQMRARWAARDASGIVYVEGSIYEGMSACLARSGRTIAHVIDYGDALALAEASNAAARAPRDVEALVDALRSVRDWLQSAPLESGCCCCGSPVADHGIGDGHSPVDELAYLAQGQIELIDAAIARTTTNKEAGDRGL